MMRGELTARGHVTVYGRRALADGVSLVCFSFRDQSFRDQSFRDQPADTEPASRVRVTCPGL
jgi:hypothetical protein